MPRSIDGALCARLAREYGTPYYLYDAAVIRAQIAALRAFDVIRYAQKALSNVHLLRLMKAEGVLVDAVSGGELERALRAGYTGAGQPAGVVFTADVIDEATLARVVALDVPVNAGSADMLEQLGRKHPGHRVWLRVNPGFGHGHSRKTNTGGPWSKHGIWHANLDEALRNVEKYRLDLVGLHMHIGSGADNAHLERVCAAMVAQVRALGIDVRAISGGGGLPIPYRADAPAFDAAALHRHWNAARREIESLLGHPVSLEIEPGRFLVAESGTLVSRLLATKRMDGTRFLLADAGFNDLIRPAMYGSYHEISVVRAEWRRGRGSDRADRRRGTAVRVGRRVHTGGGRGGGDPRAARRRGGRPRSAPRRRRLRRGAGQQLQLAHASAGAARRRRPRARDPPPPAHRRASRAGGDLAR